MFQIVHQNKISVMKVFVMKTQIVVKPDQFQMVQSVMINSGVQMEIHANLENVFQDQPEIVHTMIYQQ
jgi:hypothetical protein